MIMQWNRLTGFALIAGLALTTGCGGGTPFLPVAVPNQFSVQPETPVDQSTINEELEQLQKAKAPDYVIVPNDVYTLTVAGRPELSRPSVLVLSDGTINVAPVGKVKIGGLTIPAACDLLNQKYLTYLYVPSVTLEPVKNKEAIFTISGKISEPGIYPLLGGTTRLTDAIALAKGLQSGTFKDEPIDYADLNNSYIARDGRVLPVDFQKALSEGNQLHNIPILGGDYIYIAPLASGKITVLGEVGNPASLVYQPNLTLAQAIGYAGGLKETNSKEIKVIRGGLKNPVVFTLPINEILLGNRMDFSLKPRDIVFVPRDPLSTWNVIMRELLPTFQVLNSMAGPFGNSAAVFFNND